MRRLRAALAGPIHVIVLLLGTSLVIFGLIQLRGPAPAASDGNVPLYERYLSFIQGIACGDLGRSDAFKQPLADALLSGLGLTLALNALGSALAALIALILARLAARSGGGILDRLVQLYASLGRSTPTFWLGIMLALLVGTAVGWMTAGGSAGAFGSDLIRVDLPGTTLALVLAPRAVRRLRGSLMVERYAHHVAAARSRGLPEGLIHRRHVVRNSVIPSTGRIAGSLGFLLGATVAVEKVFGLPGLGRLLVDSILVRDYRAVALSAWLFAIALILLRFAANMAARALDPRPSS